MKLPITVELNYIGAGDLPVMTVNSTHVITCEGDVKVLTDYLNVFHSDIWRYLDVENSLKSCQTKGVFNIRKECGEFLSLRLI